jgi:hypothetical protein
VSRLPPVRHALGNHPTGVCMYMNQGEESAAESVGEYARRRAGTAHAAGRPASPSVSCARRGAGSLHARHTPHRGPRPPPSAEPAKKLFNTLCLAQGALEFAGSFASSPGPGPHPTGPGSRTRLKAPRQAPRPDLRNHRPPLHADAGNRPSHRHLRLTSPTPFLPVFLVREKKAGTFTWPPPLNFRNFTENAVTGEPGLSTGLFT